MSLTIDSLNMSKQLLQRHTVCGALVAAGSWPSSAPAWCSDLAIGKEACNERDWLLCRLQEIVFIGAGMDQAAIEKQLDGALVTDDELQRYNAKWQVASSA